MNLAAEIGGLYGAEDLRAARRFSRACALALGGAEALLLAVYVAGIALGARWLMLAALLPAFAFALFWGDLFLLPALRYRRFLRGLGEGLRRRATCEVERLEDAVQMQDGARVRALHVRLAEDGDARIYYVNVDHAARFPQPGARIWLESCGRHVTNFGPWAGEAEA